MSIRRELKTKPPANPVPSSLKPTPLNSSEGYGSTSAHSAPFPGYWSPPSHVTLVPPALHPPPSTVPSPSPPSHASGCHLQNPWPSSFRLILSMEHAAGGLAGKMRESFRSFFPILLVRGQGSVPFSGKIGFLVVLVSPPPTRGKGAAPTASGPGIEPVPQQWQYWVLNPLYHQGTPLAAS